ncbi:protein LTV1 homolog [Mytilus edulis]|uniref:protein LTV1 homolog n=1 Tax=Mytilus edulis TaxID=6550 RepID=UPI0039EDF76D
MKIKRDGYKHNQTTNGLKWTTKTAAGTVLKCNSEENKAMTEAILIYVKGQHQTVEEGVIRCGIETYFNSGKQKEIMELTGKKEEHNRKMVLYGRKHRKLINRRRTLKERKIDPKEEERFMKALEIETMSSEDSDSEDDSIFVTRPLSWVSTEFKQLIQRLDRKYDRTLNAQGKRLKSKRTVGEPSDRPCPKKPKGLEWMFG